MNETRRRFDEYATLEYLLMGDLRAAIDETPGEETHCWLAGAVASLLESLPNKLQITLELDGVFVSLEPNEQPAVFGDLHAAQRQLLATLEEIQERITESLGRAAIAEPQPDRDRADVAGRLLEWLDQLADHNRSLVEAARPLLNPAPSSPRRRRK